jgi:chemotaxis methyl-accepting protein methylase
VSLERKRQDLERFVVRRIGAATGEEPWQVFMTLDELLVHIASRADDRLSHQAQSSAES